MFRIESKTGAGEWETLFDEAGAEYVFSEATDAFRALQGFQSLPAEGRIYRIVRPDFDYIEPLAVDQGEETQ
jgi:hypothetical protein